MIDVVWDMETGDPDDFLTLLLLCGHPRVNLKAVTITPGTPKQIGLVRYALNLFDLEIPVGSFDIERQKECVSSWHYKVFGNIPESRDAIPGFEVLLYACNQDTTLITGAPLKNVGAAIKAGFRVGRWVAQGGFAGEGVVPSEWQLEKFKGMRTCPTYNFNGDPKSALAALSYDGIGERLLVSKNVCHGVYYDREVHERVTAVKDKSLSMQMIHKGMDLYLRKHPQGKKFHDPLAACCAIDDSIARWSDDVVIFRERGQWGAKPAPIDYPGPRCKIILYHKHERFLQTLTETP